MKRALITGITGQDGSYLAELLITKGYEVHGLVRRSSSFNRERISHLYTDPHEKGNYLTLHYGDLAEASGLSKLINQIEPQEVYNLGAQSHVRVSFDIPEYTSDVTGLSSVRILEAIRCSKQNIKYYQASSSEMFGSSPPPQNENTPFHPRSPYGVSKVFAFHMTVQYREAYGIHASNGILFNHESPRRGESFVTRKITNSIAKIKAGKEKYIFLGNLDSKRDWGYAPEYVEAQWIMLQQKKPDDYVIATGETHSVKEFLTEAFSYAGLNWKDHLKMDSRYLRPTEVDVLQGDYSKALKRLGWSPKVKFRELTHIMVDADLQKNGLNSINSVVNPFNSEWPV